MIQDTEQEIKKTQALVQEQKTLYEQEMAKLDSWIAKLTPEGVVRGQKEQFLEAHSVEKMAQHFLKDVTLVGFTTLSPDKAAETLAASAKAFMEKISKEDSTKQPSE